jgi:hypothetical protein
MKPKRANSAAARARGKADIDLHIAADPGDSMTI